MAEIDVEHMRRCIRAMDFERGTAVQIALWREDLADARANLIIENMAPTANEDEMFAMMLAEGVPPSLMPSIISSLYRPDDSV
ncbi:hypothetical protein Q4610_17345 [Sphingobium sp. HBC34]|jgi:hypothetical protein|uniref:Uncharacterized protein n=1 Tax=Sphingobium cyanobacteriorum TaxID=3063954 RepID=A0ABT8ZSV2_9SPHN|nr:hypothetical protein [Sphingobium sp. HBC34]MDO7836815.1 hypothetical protein [Sphingobium sp. HBC34]